MSRMHLVILVVILWNTGYPLCVVVCGVQAVPSLTVISKLEGQLYPWYRATNSCLTCGTCTTHSMQSTVSENSVQFYTHSDYRTIQSLQIRRHGGHGR